MTAFQESFQAEVVRLVRKQVKDDQAALKKSDRAQRAEVTALKHEVKALSSQVRTLTKQLERLAKVVVSQQPVKEPRAPQASAEFVFDHEALIAKRHELGLTQAQMGQLLGVSSLSAWKWETGGRAAPRQAAAASAGGPENEQASGSEAIGQRHLGVAPELDRAMSFSQTGCPALARQA